MIVGAHIAHPGLRAAEHAPSVATVVADYQGSGIHFPGSKRLQPPVTKIKNGKIVPQSQIVKLEDMMKENMEAWKNQRSGHPKLIIFYRDSAIIDDTSAYGQSADDDHCVNEKEVKAIRMRSRAFSRASPAI